MIPPSTKLAPPASTICLTARTVAGDTALASTWTPENWCFDRMGTEAIQSLFESGE